MSEPWYCAPVLPLPVFPLEEPPRLPPREEAPPLLATFVLVDLLEEANPLEEEEPPRLLRLAEDPPLEALLPPDDFFEAAFFGAAFLTPPFLAAAFFAPPFL